MFISHYGKKTCQSIVSYGTKVVIYCSVKHHRVRRPRVFSKNTNHCVGTLNSEIRSSSEEKYVTVTMKNNMTKQYKCFAPLLRSGETIEAGTVCIIDQDRSGNWNIIAAQCPEN